MTDAEKPRARRWRLGTEHLCGQKKTHGRVKHLPGSGVQLGMMTFTQAVRATEILARDMASAAIEDGFIAYPIVREDVSRVVSHLIGDQTGAYSESIAAFERIWTAAGGTFA